MALGLRIVARLLVAALVTYLIAGRLTQGQQVRGFYHVQAHYVTDMAKHYGFRVQELSRVSN